MKLKQLNEDFSGLSREQKSKHIGGYSKAMNQIERLIDQAATDYVRAFNATQDETADHFEEEIGWMIEKIR